MTRPHLAKRRPAALMTVLLVTVGSVVAGCSRQSASDQPPPECVSPADSATPVDPALLAFLSRARAAHHRADLLEEKGKIEPAVAELRKVINGPVPRAQTPYVEVGEVMADTRARIADLLSQLDQFEDAMHEVEAGLGLAKQQSYFRGHLFEVRGLVEERRAKALTK